MSKSQKLLKVFGVLELLIAIYYAVTGVLGESVPTIISAVLYLLAAILMFSAAKDARKAGGAWLITLVDLILSVAEVGFLATGGAEASMILAGIAAIILNLIAFIAANNVKKQGKNV